MLIITIRIISSDIFLLFKSILNNKFLKSWFYWNLLYLLKRPSIQAKRESISFDHDSLTYGTTPLRVWQIMKGYLSSKDSFLDLGCGRGLGLFYLSSELNIKTYGVDCVKTFIETGLFLKKHLQFDEVSFIYGNLFEFAWPKTTACFIPCTCYSDELISKLVLELKEHKLKWIFTLSTSLEEYGLSGYDIIKTPVLMPFGITTLYVHKKQETSTSF